MDNEIRALLGSQAGVLTAGEAARRDVSPEVMQRLERGGDLVRVRRGAYVSGRLWSSAGADERYRLTVLAVARTRPGDEVSHQSALAVHRLPTHGIDRSVVHVDSTAGQIVHRQGLVVHPRVTARGSQACDDDGSDGDVGGLRVDGVRVVSPARAIVRSAITSGQRTAVVAADRALHDGLVTLADLVDEVALVSPHQGRGRAEKAVLRADGKAESVFESLTRLVVVDLGFQLESQFRVVDERESVIARTDLRIGNVVLECDGRVKYLRPLVGPDGDSRPMSNAEVAEVVWREKVREDSVRRLGWGFVRIIWDDLERPGRIADWIRAAERDHRRPRAA